MGPSQDVEFVGWLELVASGFEKRQAGDPDADMRLYEIFKGKPTVKQEAADDSQLKMNVAETDATSRTPPNAPISSAPPSETIATHNPPTGPAKNEGTSTNSLPSKSSPKKPQTTSSASMASATSGPDVVVPKLPAPAHSASARIPSGPISSAPGSIPSASSGHIPSSPSVLASGLSNKPYAISLTSVPPTTSGPNVARSNLPGPAPSASASAVPVSSTSTVTTSVIPNKLPVFPIAADAVSASNPSGAISSLPSPITRASSVDNPSSTVPVSSALKKSHVRSSASVPPATSGSDVAGPNLTAPHPSAPASSVSVASTSTIATSSVPVRHEETTAHPTSSVPQSQPVAKVCWICEQAPSHPQNECPIVKEGADAINFRMVEYQGREYYPDRVKRLAAILKEAQEKEAKGRSAPNAPISSNPYAETQTQHAVADGQDLDGDVVMQGTSVQHHFLWHIVQYNCVAPIRLLGNPADAPVPVGSPTNVPPPATTSDLNQHPSIQPNNPPEPRISATVQPSVPMSHPAPIIGEARDIWSFVRADSASLSCAFRWRCVFSNRHGRTLPTPVR